MYLDSPFELCRRHGCYVLLDQTVGQCAAEHRCEGSLEDCPLREHFKGTDFGPIAKPGDGHATRRTV